MISDPSFCYLQALAFRCGQVHHIVPESCLLRLDVMVRVTCGGALLLPRFFKRFEQAPSLKPPRCCE